MNQTIFIMVILLLNLFCTSFSLAEDQIPKGYEVRREFIESRLDESRQKANYWQNGWTIFYSASAIAQTALWIDADDHDDRINYSINTLKSVAALGDIILRPLPGRYGANPLRDMPTATPEQRRLRLEAGETLLQKAAERAASSRTWLSHLKVVGVNFFAGALIAAFGDKGDAFTSTALGIAIGETNIWTQPTKYEADWQEYQQTFPSRVGQAETIWHLAPIPGGIALQARF